MVRQEAINCRNTRIYTTAVLTVKFIQHRRGARDDTQLLLILQ